MYPNGSRTQLLQRRWTPLFEAGVNATITGDMLTTVGNNTKQDQEMLTDMGFQI
ncbi:MAG: hypothetical protein V8R46_01490 [Eubacterium ramulus]